MAPSLLARAWQERDRLAVRNFLLALLVLAAAFVVALYSAVAARQGRIWVSGAATAVALGLCGWVAVTYVPRLARRTNLRRLIQQFEYRLTREGVVYLGAVGVLVLAAVNTGNNLLFMVLACMLAGILISGFLSHVVLRDVEMTLTLPEHIFAEQPLLATVELRNEKPVWPSFSLRVMGEGGKNPAQILTRPVYFPYIRRLGDAAQKVELVFPRRGVYRQDSFGIRTKFPFGFLEKTKRVESPLEIVVYPRVRPAEQFYEVLPLLSGEMVSFYRGRGHELHSLRDYQPMDSARYVDWKVSAKRGSLMVREFAREDERRLILVLDPFVGPPREELGMLGEAELAERFERGVQLAASIAWHFHEINAVMQFRTDRFVTPMAPAEQIIYDILRELAFLQAETSATGGAFLDELAAETETFKIILSSRPQGSIPASLWSSSYFIFFSSL